MIRTWLICVVVSTTVVNAQPRSEVLANARHVVDALTDPVFHGRGYVSNGDGLASTWIAKEYARIGLGMFGTGYQQPFEFNVNSFPDTVKVAVDGVRLVSGVNLVLTQRVERHRENSISFITRWKNWMTQHRAMHYLRRSPVERYAFALHRPRMQIRCACRRNGKPS
ncbi:MAG: hypothetical protein IPI91_02890 [Flavobacteriales bacterium]|nr:hypothetical protein [Flavobacteriales bacterium]